VCEHAQMQMNAAQAGTQHSRQQQQAYGSGMRLRSMRSVRAHADADVCAGMDVVKEQHAQPRSVTLLAAFSTRGSLPCNAAGDRCELNHATDV
jgi:hypothetical protein